MARRFAREMFNKHDAREILGVTDLLPRWVAVTIHSSLFVIYSPARDYIVAEGLSALRALPMPAVASANWSRLVPHLRFLVGCILSFRLASVMKRTDETAVYDERVEY